MDLRELAGQQLHRYSAVESRALGEDRSLEFSFSSEQPVERWFGSEVLSHEAAAADLTRLNDGAPVLFNHDPDRVIGVVERAWIDGEKRRGMARVRFSRTELAQQIVADITDGILRNVSVGYRIADAEQRDAAIVATSWQAHEVSVVSVPADQSVPARDEFPGVLALVGVVLHVEVSLTTGKTTRLADRSQSPLPRVRREARAHKYRSTRMLGHSARFRPWSVTCSLGGPRMFA